MEHPEHELSELAEGALHGAAAAEVRAHLRTCLACQASFVQLAVLHNRFAAIPQLQPSAAFLQGVQTRVRTLPPMPSRPHWRVVVVTLVVGVLALLPSLDVVLNLFQGSMHVPAFTDWSGWFTWLDQLSANVEATLVIGLCAVAVACVLVVAQTLTILQPQSL